MSTETALAAETTILEDLDFPTPCDCLQEDQVHDCQNPADYYVRLDCPHLRLWCDYDLRRNLETHSFHCRACMAEFSDGHARKILHYSPLPSR